MHITGWRAADMRSRVEWLQVQNGGIFFVIMDGDIVGECIRAVTEMMSKRKVLSANWPVIELAVGEMVCQRFAPWMFRPVNVRPC